MEQRRVFFDWWKQVDRVSVILIVMLMTIGLVLVAAASPAISSRIGTSSFYFVNRQWQHLLLGVFLIVIISALPENRLKAFCAMAFAVMIVLMTSTLMWGAEVKGSRRWLNIYGFSLQASELLKPFYGMFTAMILTHYRHRAYYPFFLSAAIHTVIVLLLLAQPDFGMAVTVSIVTGLQWFIGGIPAVLICCFTAALGTVGYLSYLSFSHVAKRIENFLSPQADASYQLYRSLESYVNGGLYGRGPGEGHIKYLLPDSHTDFIFAVAGEELGVFFCLTIVAVMGALVLRGLHNVMLLQRKYCLMLGAANGLLYFAFQSIFNIAVTLSLLPTKGMTLPFISYGGSSIISLSISMGIYLNATRYVQSSTTRPIQVSH